MPKGKRRASPSASSTNRNVILKSTIAVSILAFALHTFLDAPGGSGDGSGRDKAETLGRGGVLRLQNFMSAEECRQVIEEAAPTMEKFEWNRSSTLMPANTSKLWRSIDRRMQGNSTTCPTPN